MKISTDGLIIGEQNIGEQDRLITVLTRKRGIIKAFVKNCRSLKSAKGSATRLLCYSRLVLYINRDTYIVDEATCDEMFIKLRTDIVNMSLAQYFCELCGVIVSSGIPDGEFLRLILNSLHFLTGERRYPPLIKAITELRAAAIAGFMPDLVA